MERAEQEALLDLYRSARKSRLERWRYRMRVAEAVAAYKEGDETGEALFGEIEDEAEDNAGSDEVPLHWRRRGPAPPRPRDTNNEPEDTAGSTEAPPRQQRGRGHCRLRRGPASPTMRQRTSPAQPRPHLAGNVGEDFHRSAEAPPAGNETEALPAPPRPRPAANEAAPHRK